MPCLVPRGPAEALPQQMEFSRDHPERPTGVEHGRAVGGGAADPAALEEPLVPAGPASGFVGGTVESVRGIWRYRELLGLLVRRELKARYKDSALGLLLDPDPPARPAARSTTSRSGKFLGAERGDPGLRHLHLHRPDRLDAVREIVSGGTGSIVANAGLIKKIYLPREVFPLSVVGSALFNFAHPARCILRRRDPASSAVPDGRRLALLPAGRSRSCWSGHRPRRSCCPPSTCTCATSSTSSRSRSWSCSGVAHRLLLGAVTRRPSASGWSRRSTSPTR